MDILRYRSDAWGQQVLEGVSWDLVWVFVVAGFSFVLVHAVYANWRKTRRNCEPPDE